MGVGINGLGQGSFPLVSSALQRKPHARRAITLQFTLQACWTVFNMEAIEEY
jgi:hypothetical protein